MYAAVITFIVWPMHFDRQFQLWWKHITTHIIIYYILIHSIGHSLPVQYYSFSMDTYSLQSNIYKWKIEILIVGNPVNASKGDNYAAADKFINAFPTS